MSKLLVSKNDELDAFKVANGVNIWQYAVANPSFSEIFNKAMACISKYTMATLLRNYAAVFDGIGCLVDVGGGNGTALRTIVKACPWVIRAINFDLPHVVSPSNNDDTDYVEHVGGNMFESVPKADAVFTKSVLHDWDDEACVQILKNCREAIPRETGKVIIVDIVVDDDYDDNLNKANDMFREYHLAVDIEMMTQTTRGKERTSKEWADILKTAGFTKHTVRRIPGAPQSCIEAYP